MRPLNPLDKTLLIVGLSGGLWTGVACAETAPPMEPPSSAPAAPAPAESKADAKEAKPEEKTEQKAAPAPPPAAAALPTPDAPPSVDLKSGALYGKVVDTTGKPVPDATVALLGADGKVAAWTKTDAQGRYLLAADPLKVLRLKPSRQRGLLSRLVGGVGKVVAAPVRLAGSAVSTAAGVAKETAKSGAADLAKGAVATAVTGNPLPAASGVAKAVANETERQVKERAMQKLQDQAARTVTGERQSTKKEERKTLVPGEVLVAVSAPNFKEARGVAGTYWLEPGEDEGEKPVGPKAWLETVKLAPFTGDGKSEIANEALLLADARLEPSMASAGGTVKVRVKLQAPADLAPNVRVFAREDRKRVVTELKKGEGNEFSGDLQLDPKTPDGPTRVTVVALRSEPVEVKLPKDKEDPLLKFVAELDDLDPDKPYDYDPRIMASENRMELALTVLDPKKGTPVSSKP